MLCYRKKGATVQGKGNFLSTHTGMKFPAVPWSAKELDWMSWSWSPVYLAAVMDLMTEIPELISNHVHCPQQITQLR